MDHLKGKIIIFCLALALLLSGCSASQNRSIQTLPQQETPATENPARLKMVSVQESSAESAEDISADSISAPQDRTLLIYMVGSDLESDHGYASADIDEILGCEDLADGFQIYLCTGGSPFWWNPDIPSDACTIFSVEEGKLIPEHSLPDGSMADPDTVTWFLNQTETDPQARQVSLIFWNHGGGITTGYGADANYDYDILSVPQLCRAVDASDYRQNGGRFRYIGFDACLMGMAEVADLFKDSADYLVASEEVEPGTGWDYSCLDELSLPENASGDRAGAVIAKAYEAAVVNESPYEIEYTISVLDLAVTEEVTAALEDLMRSMDDDLTLDSYAQFSRLRQHSRSFGSRSRSSFDSMDLLDFARSVNSRYPSQSKALLDALKKFIVCNRTNMTGANGVAVYFPFQDKEDAADRLTQYASIGFCSAYTDFICSFHRILTGAPVTTWTVSETIPGIDNETLSMTLAPDQAASFAQASSMIWEDLHENGEYKCWYRGGSSDLTEDGKLYSRFDGRIFRLIDDTTGDYAPCMVIETDRDADSVTYKTVLSIIRTPEVPEALEGTIDGAMAAGAWEFYVVNAYITVNEEHPDGYITGMYVTSASKVGYPSFLPSASDFTIQKGDIVQCIQLCRKVTYYEDGSVRPFSDWENTGTYRGYDFTAEGSISVGAVPYDEDTDYCCVFSITDTQQNTYMSDFVPMSDGKD